MGFQTKKTEKCFYCLKSKIFSFKKISEIINDRHMSPNPKPFPQLGERQG